MNRPQYVLYFSHSWRPEHVDLNLAFWDHLWADCLLLADENREAEPPYYVARIEYLLRRADLFLAVVAPPAQPTEGEQPHSISPFILFEIALAERAHLPGLVVYDRRIAFPADRVHNGWLQFVPTDLSEVVARKVNPFWRDIIDWLKTVTAAAKPRIQVPAQKATFLLPKSSDRAEVCETVKAAFKRQGYETVEDLLLASNDLEICDRLRDTHILIAELSDQGVWDVYGMAHALGIPTIRLVRNAASLDAAGLPQVLRPIFDSFENAVVDNQRLPSARGGVGTTSGSGAEREALGDFL